MTPKPTLTLSVVFLLVMSCLAPRCEATGGTAGSEEATLRAQLGPIPQPDVTRLEETVAVQLHQARTDLEQVLAEPGASSNRLAQAYGTLGQYYHAYELFDPADACYGNATVLDPQNFTWHHLLGDVSRHRAQLEDAAAHFGAAWALEPRDFAALVYLGEVSVELNRNEEAEAAFKAALLLDPDSPSVMAGLGKLALNHQQYDEAVRYLEAALEAIPEANRLHYSLAMAYRGLGKMEEARNHLELRGTVGLRPSDPVLDQLLVLTQGERVHLVRGRLAFAAGRYEEARREFEIAVNADPESARSIINLGTALGKLGDSDGAAERYRQALEVDPEQTIAHFNLGNLLLAEGRPEEAIPHLKRTVKDTPLDAEARLFLARALVGTGDDTVSLEHFEQAAKLDPASEDAVIGGASALIRLGLYFRAKPVLVAGLERMPESGRIAFALTRLLAACPEADVRDGERALDLALRVYDAQKTPRHAQLVAQALAENGRCEDAATWQQRVIDAAVEDGATEVLMALRADQDGYAAGPPCRPPMREKPQ